MASDSEEVDWLCESENPSEEESTICEDLELPDSLYKPIANTYTFFQDAFLTKSSIEQLLNVKKEKAYLSKENILNSKIDQLVEKLEYVKTKYGKRSSN